MSILDNIAIFIAVIKNGGFSHAAKQLGLSNGLISRRIVQLESELGVTLIKRTTRQFQLTPEGALLLQHAQRIQCDWEAVISLIHSSTNKPQGLIRVSAPLYLGRHYFTPMLVEFLNKFREIKIELDLSNQRHDPIKEQFDLVIRGAGYQNQESLNDSNLKMKLLMRSNIGLYASAAYLKKHGEPHSINELSNHVLVSYGKDRKLLADEKWKYHYKNKAGQITVTPYFKCNDIEASLNACLLGYGIGKFTNLIVKEALKKKKLFPILNQHSFGEHHLYAVYSNQQNLPARTRLLLDFLYAKMQALKKDN